jgi:hypothetical protein
VTDLSSSENSYLCDSGMATTPEHEGLHRIFAEDKAVLASVLSPVLKVDLPVPARMDELNVDLTEFKPVVERRSDTVLRVKAASGNPAEDYILLVESQTEEDWRPRWKQPIRAPPATSVSSPRPCWKARPALRYGGH